MTTQRKSDKNRRAKKLRVKKETLKDLGVKGKDVKGGMRIRSIITDCTCSCTPWCK
jgi:hypothetical protein